MTGGKTGFRLSLNFDSGWRTGYSRAAGRMMPSRQKAATRFDRARETRCLSVNRGASPAPRGKEGPAYCWQMLRGPPPWGW
jgi:hypothetical protein